MRRNHHHLELELNIIMVITIVTIVTITIMIIVIVIITMITLSWSSAGLHSSSAGRWGPDHFLYFCFCIFVFGAMIIFCILYFCFCIFVFGEMIKGKVNLLWFVFWYFCIFFIYPDSQKVELIFYQMVFIKFFCI